MAVSSRIFPLLSHSLLHSPSHLPLGLLLFSSLLSFPFHPTDSATGAELASPELLRVGEESLGDLCLVPSLWSG